MLESMIIIDIETQDFSVESGIYEVACIVVRNSEIIDKLYLGNEIEDWDGERIFGYGFYNICYDENSIAAFKGFIEKYNYPLVAHNCPFDRKFLLYYDWIPNDYPCYCSMRAIRNSITDLDSYSLKKLIRHFNISDKVSHKAFDDVIILHEILKISKPDTWMQVGIKSLKYHAKKDINVNVSGYNQTNKLLNEVICFTGASKYTRDEMQAIAKANGAEISNNITTKTTMLVVGLNAGSKLTKAQEKDIVIISDDEFMEVLGIASKEVMFERHDKLKGETITSKTNKLSPKQKDIEIRKTKFLPQSVYNDRKKKWYEWLNYEADLWFESIGEIDENGVEWKPLNILERFSNAEGYYVSSNYELKRPNDVIVPMQATIKGKAFGVYHYAMLFMVEEYNSFIKKYKYIYIKNQVDDDYISKNKDYLKVVEFKYCFFVLSNYDLRPQTSNEAIEQEVERIFNNKYGLSIGIYFTEEAEQEAIRQENLEKEKIRKALITELRKKNITV